MASTKKLTTAEFIEKARTVHGARYGYELAVYEGGKAKVKITCLEHGLFEQQPGNHLQGQGCPKCGRLKLVAGQRLDTASFIAKAQAIHGSRYDYSQVVYGGNNIEKVTIICREHGGFEQGAGSHLRGINCPKCGRAKLSQALADTTETFIEKARAVHGDKYDYSQVVYSGNQRNKVSIACREHGAFEQAPVSHINQKAGCPTCAGKQPLTRADFLTRARAVHGDKYDYSQVVFVRTRGKVKITCSEHGLFEQSAESHAAGKGCAKCAGNNTMELADFLTRARAVHGDKYDYSQVVYTSSKKLVAIQCLSHGSFKQSPGAHLIGSGCPVCGRSKSDLNRRKSTAEFIEKACTIHGSRYDYSQVVYQSQKAKVTIICPEHGEFKQVAMFHRRGAGCPRCAIENGGGGGWSATAWATNQKGRPARLYIIRLYSESESFYKVGITFSAVRRRYDAKYPYLIQIIAVFESLDAALIYRAEKDIKRQFKQLKYLPKEQFTGYTECFNSVSEILSFAGTLGFASSKKEPRTRIRSLISL